MSVLLERILTFQSEHEASLSRRGKLAMTEGKLVGKAAAKSRAQAPYDTGRFGYQLQSLPIHLCLFCRLILGRQGPGSSGKATINNVGLLYNDTELGFRSDNLA